MQPFGLIILLMQEASEVILTVGPFMMSSLQLSDQIWTQSRSLGNMCNGWRWCFNWIFLEIFLLDNISFYQTFVFLFVLIFINIYIGCKPLLYSLEYILCFLRRRVLAVVGSNWIKKSVKKLSFPSNKYESHIVITRCRVVSCPSGALNLGRMQFKATCKKALFGEGAKSLCSVV